MARNNEDLARRNEELKESLEMAAAWALAEQKKTNYAQEQLVKSERKLERSKKGTRHAGRRSEEEKQIGLHKRSDCAEGKDERAIRCEYI